MRAVLAIALLLLPAWPALAADAQDDCGSGGDAPFSPRDGVVVPAPGSCRGFIDGEDERDGYRFDVAPGLAFNVTVTPDAEGAQAVLFLFRPDHGDGMQPVFEAWGYGSVEATTGEPGLWQLYLYVCSDASCARFAATGYTLAITTEGEPHPSSSWNGTLRTGLPAGPRANALLGPGSSPEVDATWIRLPEDASFARLAWADCAGCLRLRFADGDQRDLFASCGTRAASHECFVPPGAMWARVEALGGLDTAWTLTAWRGA